MQSLKSEEIYILYIYVERNEVRAMALANINKIDGKLAKIYAEQVTTNVSNSNEDKSHILFEQMNMIALNNKALINFKH